MHRSLVCLLVALLLFSMPQPSTAHDSPYDAEATAPGLSGQSLYNLASLWQTQDGQTVALASLRGRPVVMAMAYTSCPDMCPIIIHDMQHIEGDLAPSVREHTRFVVVSFDSSRDTPQLLKEFAAAHGLDLKHWTLLHGNKQAVQEVAAVLGVRYRQKKNGGFEHSNIISLLDADGVVVDQMIGLQDHAQRLEQEISELVPK